MDSLDTLPIDNSKDITPQELLIIQRYCGTVKNSKFWEELKEISIATIFFIVLSTNYFENVLDLLPNSDSTIFRLGMKALIYATLLYVAIVMLA